MGNHAEAGGAWRRARKRRGDGHWAIPRNGLRANPGTLADRQGAAALRGNVSETAGAAGSVKRRRRGHARPGEYCAGTVESQRLHQHQVASCERALIILRLVARGARGAPFSRIWGWVSRAWPW